VPFIEQNVKAQGYEQIARTIAERYGCKIVEMSIRTSISASRNEWTGIAYDASNGH
jgi:2-dehydro-3-deoxygluconokinase